MVDEWKNALDKKFITGAVFMDLSKSFDCLPHGWLIAKCHAYGVTVPACELLADNLSQRKQRVKIGSARSSWADLHKGVPQGSILGPLLFNIFINDLFLFIEKCSLYNYADDNTISYSAPCLFDVLSNLQSDCNHAIEWFNSNDIKANPDKFQFMMLSSSSLAPVELLLDFSTYVTSQDCVKVLGITIDKQLTFNEHISLLLHTGCPAIKCFRQNIEVFKSEFPSYYTPQFYSQQFKLLPTRLAFLWQDKQCKTRKDPRTIATYHV